MHFAVQLIFLERWTLTAIHDVMNAWSGLGAALITLWRQQRVAASVVATLEVTIYLACISILHITTLALFSMETFNNVGSVTTSTIIGMPSITNISYNPGIYMLMQNFSRSTSQLLPYLSSARP
ncbi:hypothetical protein AcV5_000154 [Taiwanofungus camphoratus]|nr:hypothetical protein AcV5_000154 [Antrodia cinnamomea]